jgi:hypothetical protein
MAFNLFGFQFGKNSEEKPLSFAPPPLDDGASFVEAGGLQGYYIDLDGTLRSDSDLMRKYREMSLHAEVDMAINSVVNDFLTVDAKGIFVKLNTDKINLPYPIRKIIIEEFENVLRLLDFNRKGHEIIRRWYVDGKLYYHQILHDDPKMGIRELRQIDPLKIKKIKEVVKKTRLNNVDMINDYVEYYVYTPYEKTNTYTNSYETVQGLRIAADAINYCHSGLYDSVSRRVVSHLHKAIKPLNQLRMVEDATVIYRWSRAPERRVFYIDVGSLPKVKAEQYLRDQMNRYRNKIVYDAGTGEVRDDKKHMSMLEDFWLPRREGGKGTEISTLPGGQNLGEMADVEYFQKKLYMSLNIPITRMQADNGFNMGRASEITRDELKFAKFIDRMRVKFAELFLNSVKTQLLAKQVMNESDWKDIEQDLKVEFSTDSYFAESKQSELLKDRIGILREVADYSGKYFSDKWIRKNILRQTDDEIEEIDREIEEEKAIQTAEIEAQSAQQQAETQMEAQAQAEAGGGEVAPSAENASATSPQQVEEQPISKNIYDVSDLL